MLEKILEVVDVCASKIQLSLELRNNSLHWSLGNGNANSCLVVSSDLDNDLSCTSLFHGVCKQDTTLFKTTIKLHFIESHVNTNNW